MPVRVNREEVNENPIWEPKRNTRQMVNHPSKYLGYFPVWIHWCDLRNELSLICAVPFSEMLWQCLSPGGSNCISISRAAGQGQLPAGPVSAAQGRSAFLPGHAQPHRALMSCGILVLDNPSFWVLAMRNLSGNPGNGSGILHGLQTPAQLRRGTPFLIRKFPLSKGLTLEINVWSSGGTPPSP